MQQVARECGGRVVVEEEEEQEQEQEQEEW
jgi:hypothetical protein